VDKYEVKEVIGGFLEGIESSNAGRGLVNEVLNSVVLTNQGYQRYYIDIDTLLLDHVDLSEAIWSLADGESYQGNIDDIVFFDELKYQEALRSKIVAQDNGVEKWQCLNRKILNRIKAIIG
jgi:hypothetical protein